MKLQILSDLHIEFEDFSILRTDSDAVVLAGDTHIREEGVSWVLENIPDKLVIYILGNHEYYGKVYPKHFNALKNMIRGTYVHVLEDDIMEVEGVNIFGCTLWTDFNLFGNPVLSGFECQQLITDFRQIRLLPRYSRLRSLDVARIHQRSLKWLEEQLSQHMGEINVVVTHHAPSPASLPAIIRDNRVNAAYASRLEYVIKKYSPHLWVHGHIHSSSDYRIGKCRVICNPRGYPHERNPEFDPTLVIDMDAIQREY